MKFKSTAINSEIKPTNLHVLRDLQHNCNYHQHNKIGFTNMYHYIQYAGILTDILNEKEKNDNNHLSQISHQIIQ